MIRITPNARPMDDFDAVAFAESIVARAALAGPSSPTAGLRLPAPAPQPAVIEVRVESVERGLVTAVDLANGLRRQLIAPPLIAEALKRVFGAVRVRVDAREHILTIED